MRRGEERRGEVRRERRGEWERGEREGGEGKREREYESEEEERDSVIHSPKVNPLNGMFIYLT